MFSIFHNKHFYKVAQISSFHFTPWLPVVLYITDPSHFVFPLLLKIYPPLGYDNLRKGIRSKFLPQSYSWARPKYIICAQ